MTHYLIYIRTFHDLLIHVETEHTLRELSHALYRIYLPIYDNYVQA